MRPYLRYVLSTLKGNKQTGEDFHKGRTLTGASEVYNALHGSTKTISNLLEQKFKRTNNSLSWNTPMQFYWGSFLEDLHRMIIEKIRGIEIYTPDTNVKKLDMGVSVSLDGLGIDNDGILKTFEFKMPYTRIPDGKIKPQYYYQVQTGFNIVPQVYWGVFSEIVVRLCPYEELETNYYVRHPNDEYSKPEYIAILGYHIDPSDMKGMKNITKLDCGVFDFSSCDEDLRPLLPYLNTGKLIKFCKPEEYSPFENHEFNAYVCVKVMQINQYNILRDPNFIGEDAQIRLLQIKECIRISKLQNKVVDIKMVDKDIIPIL